METIIYLCFLGQISIIVEQLRDAVMCLRAYET